MFYEIMKPLDQAVPATLIAAVYLTTNAIAPPFEPVELGIGHRTVWSAISTATGRSSASLKQDHDRMGDFGDVAYMVCEVLGPGGNRGDA